MIKHLSKISGLAASFAVIAATASAEVKINDNLSLDGYAIGSLAITEGTPVRNDTFLEGSRLTDSAKVALNGKYEDFSGKVSLYYFPNTSTSVGNGGLLDAYVTYTAGEIAITAGKFNSWFGYESFDSVNNAFIDYGLSTYIANYTTGAKVEYLTKEFSAGVSVRDSLFADSNGFFQGDGEFSDDLGYEAYVLYSGIEKLTVFAAFGYESEDSAGDDAKTYNVWASYAFTDKFSVALEYARVDDFADTSYLLQATYIFSENISVSARVTAADTVGGDGFGTGLASTYTFSPNFSIKAEVAKTDFNAGGPDPLFYAVQGVFKF
jgi:hypothetical protein